MIAFVNIQKSSRIIKLHRAINIIIFITYTIFLGYYIGKIAAMQTRLQKSLNQCGICFEKCITQGRTESCKHNFCFDCIHKWAERENSCPLCKRRFKTIQKVQKRVRYNQKYQVEDKIVEVTPKNQQQRLNMFLDWSLDERVSRLGEEEDMGLFSFLFNYNFFFQEEFQP